MKTSAIPHGYHTATPYLVVKNAPAAIEFYKKAFGAVELLRLLTPAGTVAHAEIKIGDSPLMITDEFPEWGNFSPHSPQGSSGHIHLYVDDVDAVARRAVDAGAKLLIPVADQFYGDRGGRLADPFGHIWIVATHKEDVPPDEMQRRFDDAMQMR